MPETAILLVDCPDRRGLVATVVRFYYGFVVAQHKYSNAQESLDETLKFYNITQATDNRGIVAAYGPPGRFLHSALAAFSVQDTLDFFTAEGVATKVEATGNILQRSSPGLVVEIVKDRFRPKQQRP